MWERHKEWKKKKERMNIKNNKLKKRNYIICYELIKEWKKK